MSFRRYAEQGDRGQLYGEAVSADFASTERASAASSSSLRRSN